MNKTQLIWFCLLVLLKVPFAEACTGTCLINNNGMVIAENVDQDPNNKGDIHIHARGFISSSYMFGVTGEPYRWIAKYGSLSIGQMGLSAPSGGMNEAGLFAHRLAFDNGDPKHISGVAGQPFLHTFQVPQMILDTCATVDEAIERLKQVRIYHPTFPLHYWFCDASGKCAGVDFDKTGQLQIHAGTGMPEQTFANTSYDIALEWFQKSFPSNKDQTPVSDWRFATAAKLTKNLPIDASLIDYGFGILKAVTQPGWLLWQIVYAPLEQKIYLRHNKSPDFPNGVQMFDLNKINFSLDNHGAFIPLTPENSGDMTMRFQPWSRARNAEVIQQPALSDIGLIPSVIAQAMIKHDKQSMCENYLSNLQL